MNSIEFSRRKFLASAATLSALAVARPASLFAETKPASKVAHQFCAFEKPFQFLSFDETADLLASCGFNGVEATIRDGGHVSPAKVETELPTFVDALKKRGLKMTVLTSSINSLESANAEKVLRTAAKLGIKKYRLLWYQYDLQKPILPQLDAIRPRLKGLASLNRELGLTGLYQNHSGEKLVGAPLWDIYGLIKEFDAKELAIAFDIRHATVEGGLSWPIQFNLVKSHLGAVFVKDFVWEKGKVKSVPLGEGLVDKRFFTMLKESNFAGPISVHVEYLERSKDKKILSDAFARDLATLRNLF